MNYSNLQGHLPPAAFSQLQETCDKFLINTKERLAHFLGQCDHESCCFRDTRENLNYSAEALRSLFPAHFTAASANTYARKPQQIANRLYANRNGNGNEASGDGWKHRGMGYIQLTGKTNQQGFFEFIGLPPGTDPAEIADNYPLLSAAYFWDLNNLNQLADKGVTEAVITEITRKVNGGTNGLKERCQLTLKYYQILARETASPVSA